jgi:hypothetical protein
MEGRMAQMEDVKDKIIIINAERRQRSYQDQLILDNHVKGVCRGGSSSA